MARISAIHYIEPSAVIITPNANNSANDLAVYVSDGTGIKVYSPVLPELGAEEGSYQEWSFAGENRRLADSSVPYTIYARLEKTDRTKGYLVFAPQRLIDGVWTDKYSYVIGTGTGQSSVYYDEDSTCWYVRLGEVSLPSEGLRTVTFDTGILGTEAYNAKMEYVNSNIYYFGDTVTPQTPYLEHQESEQFNGLHTSSGISADGNIVAGGNVNVGGNLTVRGSSSLGVVTEGTWQGTPIEYDRVAAHYIGRTRTQSGVTVQDPNYAGQVLEGITRYQFEGSQSQSGEIGFEIVLINGTTRAIHTTLPLYSDSWIASGGVGSGGGGGGGGGSSDITVEVSGNGNVLTNVSYNTSTSVLSFTKGTTLGTAATRNVASSLSSASGTGLSTEGAVVNYVASQLSSFSTTLGGLTDVTLSSPSNGQVLTYNSSTSKWVNGSIDVGVITVTPSVASGSHLSFSVSPSSKKGDVTLTVGVATNYAIPSSSQISSWNTASANVADGAYLASTIGNNYVAKATTADTWTTARNFTIKDSDGTNTGAATSVRGDDNETLYLPSTIKATLSGNASTATKFANSVSLWGNSFDGSSDLSSTLVVNARIGLQLYEQDTATEADRYRLTLGHLNESGKKTTACIYNYSSGLSSYANVLIGTTSNGLLYHASTGNVGIGLGNGATTPAYKLHVSGTFCATGNTSIGGTLGVSGAATFGSTITLNNDTASNRKIIFGSSSNGYIVWDSANEAIHIVGNLYADGWVASGGIGTGGSSGGGVISTVYGSSSLGGTFNDSQLDNTFNAYTINAIHGRLSTVEEAYASKAYVDNAISGLSDGTVKRVALTMPTGFSVDGSPVTSTGTFAVTFASGYSLLTTTQKNTWNDAVTTANNAASAITAINARTIWGQTFNGNVSGNMTGVGTINGYSLGGTIANNNNGFVTGDAVYDYAAKAILFGGTTYTQSGGLITITTANIISAIGTTPVARATADASGNTITTTYATKSELSSSVESIEEAIFSTNNAVAENRARIADIEAWKVAPTANTAYINSLGVNTINLDGLDVWRESNVAIVGGNIKAKISSSSDASVKAENSSGQIGLVASNGIRGIQNFASTNQWLIATNGTNTKLLLGNVSIGADYSSDYKLYVGGATSITGNTSVGGTLGVLGTAVFGSGSNYGEVIRIATSSNKKRIYFGSISDSTPYLEVINVAASGQTPVYAFHFSKNLYADGWVASGGIGSSSGGGGGASTLNDLDDVTITGTPQAGQILTYENNAWRNVTPSYNYASSVKVGNTTYQSQNNLVTIPFSVVSPVPTLSWGQEVLIASLAGKDIKVKLPSEPSYSLLAATSGALGGIKIGYGESSANRAVKLNSSSQAYITLTGSGIAEVLGTTAVTNATNATNAVTATNLANKPSLDASGNQITVTAGGKTSIAFTVPFATVASKLGTTQVGSSTIPIYIDSNGLPQTIQYTLGEACEKGFATSVNSTSTKLVTSQAVYNYLIDFATNAELEATNNAVAEDRLRIADLEDWKAYPTANTAYVKSLGVGTINLDGVDIWREAAVAVVGGGIAAQKTTTSDTFVKARNSNGEIGLLTSSNRGVYDFSRTEEVNGVTQSSPKWLITTNGTNTRLSCGNVAIGDSFNNNYKFYVNGTAHLNGATTISDTLTFNGSNRKIVFNSGTNECYLVYDSSNSAIHVVGNLYADGWIASGGIGSGSGGGGGVVSTVYGYSALGGTFNNSDLNNTFNAYTINAVYGMANSAIQSVAASTTDSSPSYVLTSISKIGTAVTSTKAAIYYNKVSLNGSTQSIVTSTNTAVTLYAPTTAGTAGYYLMSNGSGAPSWAEMSVTHLNKAASLGSSDSANRVMTAAGLEFYSTAQQTSDTPTQLSVGTGALVQWVRYVSNSSGTYNTVSQLFSPISSNRLFYRNSWASGHYPGSGGDTTEWKAWLEVATIGEGGTGSLASSFIHTYTIKRSLASGNGSWTTNYTAYQSPAAFSTKNLVTAIYDSSDNQIMADVGIVASGTSYCVTVSFAESIGSSDTFRLVVYGL